MGEQGYESVRQDIVGGEHERAVVGCAVGAGIQRGATSAGDGEGDADAAERERGMLNSINGGTADGMLT